MLVDTLASRGGDIHRHRTLLLRGSRNFANLHQRPNSVKCVVEFGPRTFWKSPNPPPVTPLYRIDVEKGAILHPGSSKFPTFWKNIYAENPHVGRPSLPLYIYGANRLLTWSISGPELPGVPHCTPRYRIDVEKVARWRSGFPNFQLSGDIYAVDPDVGRRVGFDGVNIRR